MPVMTNSAIKKIRLVIHRALKQVLHFPHTFLSCAMPKEALVRASCVISSRLNSPLIRPWKHRNRAVGQLDDSSISEEDHQHGHARVPELANDVVTSPRAAASMPPGRLIENDDLRIVDSARAITTFCWLPPERLPI